MDASGSEISWIPATMAWVIAAVTSSSGILTAPAKKFLQGESMNEATATKRDQEREAAFLKAVDENYGIISKVCRAYCNTRTEQEDLYQEIVYQLWKAYPDYKADSKISTWMYTIALRTAIMPFRRRALVEFQENPPDQPAPEEPAIGITDERLFNLFLRLGNFERAVLALMLEGYTQKEIGKIMGLREKTVQMRLNRAKNMIKDY